MNRTLRSWLDRIVRLFRSSPRSVNDSEVLRPPSVDLAPHRRYVDLDLSGTDIELLPDGISVQFALRLRGCHRLLRLPTGLKVGSLDARECKALEGLPEGIEASFLDISDCPQIEAWPVSGSLRVGRLRARNCLGLRGLPPWLGRLSQLDLAGCTHLGELPEGLEVTSWIDLADTSIRSLPNSLQGVGLRWRGVAIDERIAFRPEEIRAGEVLSERNAELRRVKLERMGFARFLAESDPEVLDADDAPGGMRKLFRVALGDDEPLVCVSVICPSTGRQYLLRVPPATTTCREAVAWTAGYDNPDDYRPIAET